VLKAHMAIELNDLKFRNTAMSVAPNVKIPKLQYFELGGRGEPVRIACAVAGITYIDERLSFPEFGKMKAAGAFPTGAVPVWIEDDIKFT